MGTLSIVLGSILTLLVILIAAAWLPSAQIFGDVMYRLDTEEKQVVLTFDDGPQPITSEFLDVLAEQDVDAVFFVTGDHAQKHPGLIDRMVEEGHQIALHSMTHRHLISNNKYEIVEAKHVIEEIIQEYTQELSPEIRYFRPPYGLRTPTTMVLARSQNLTTVTWSNFPYDYKATGEKTLEKTLKHLKSGDIIVLHDGVPNANETLRILPELITQVRAQGYEFVLLE